MKTKPSPATDTHSNANGLTLAQQSAVDLLAAGKNDTETADALNVNRVTVTRWRLYSPEFRAALAERRAAIWGATADRLRALLPKALDTLAAELARPDNPDRATVALAVLKMAGPLPIVPTESIDPFDYVLAATIQERDRMGSNLDRLLETAHGLPDFGEHIERVREKLSAMSQADNTLRPAHESLNR